MRNQETGRLELQVPLTTTPRRPTGEMNRSYGISMESRTRSNVNNGLQVDRSRETTDGTSKGALMGAIPHPPLKLPTRSFGTSSAPSSAVGGRRRTTPLAFGTRIPVKTEANEYDHQKVEFGLERWIDADLLDSCETTDMESDALIAATGPRVHNPVAVTSDQLSPRHGIKGLPTADGSFGRPSGGRNGSISPRYATGGRVSSARLVAPGPPTAQVTASSSTSNYVPIVTNPNQFNFSLASVRESTLRLEAKTHTLLSQLFQSEADGSLPPLTRHTSQLSILDDTVKELSSILAIQCNDQARLLWRIWSSASDLYGAVYNELTDTLQALQRHLEERSIAASFWERRARESQMVLKTHGEGNVKESRRVIIAETALQRCEERILEKERQIMAMQTTLADLTLWFPSFHRYRHSVLRRFLPPVEIINEEPSETNNDQNSVPKTGDGIVLKPEIAQTSLVADIRRLEGLDIGLEIKFDDSRHIPLEEAGALFGANLRDSFFGSHAASIAEAIAEMSSAECTPPHSRQGRIAGDEQNEVHDDIDEVENFILPLNLNAELGDAPQEEERISLSRQELDAMIANAVKDAVRDCEERLTEKQSDLDKLRLELANVKDTSREQIRKAMEFAQFTESLLAKAHRENNADRAKLESALTASRRQTRDVTTRMLTAQAAAAQLASCLPRNHFLPPLSLTPFNICNIEEPDDLQEEEDPPLVEFLSHIAVEDVFFRCADWLTSSPATASGPRGGADDLLGQTQGSEVWRYEVLTSLVSGQAVHWRSVQPLVISLAGGKTVPSLLAAHIFAFLCEAGGLSSKEALIYLRDIAQTCVFWVSSSVIDTSGASEDKSQRGIWLAALFGVSTSSKSPVCVSLNTNAHSQDAEHNGENGGWECLAIEEQHVVVDIFFAITRASRSYWKPAALHHSFPAFHARRILRRVFEVVGSPTSLSNATSEVVGDWTGSVIEESKDIIVSTGGLALESWWRSLPNRSFRALNLVVSDAATHFTTTDQLRVEEGNNLPDEDNIYHRSELRIDIVQSALLSWKYTHQLREALLTVLKDAHFVLRRVVPLGPTDRRYGPLLTQLLSRDPTAPALLALDVTNTSEVDGVEPSNTLTETQRRVLEFSPPQCDARLLHTLRVLDAHGSLSAERFAREVLLSSPPRLVAALAPFLNTMSASISSVEARLSPALQALRVADATTADNTKHEESVSATSIQISHPVTNVMDTPGADASLLETLAVRSGVAPVLRYLAAVDRLEKDPTCESIIQRIELEGLALTTVLEERCHHLSAVSVATGEPLSGFFLSRNLALRIGGLTDDHDIALDIASYQDNTSDIVEVSNSFQERLYCLSKLCFDPALVTVITPRLGVQWFTLVALQASMVTSSVAHIQGTVKQAIANSNQIEREKFAKEASKSLSIAQPFLTYEELDALSDPAHAVAVRHYRRLTLRKIFSALQQYVDRKIPT